MRRKQQKYSNFFKKPNRIISEMRNINADENSNVKTSKENMFLEKLICAF